MSMIEKRFINTINIHEVNEGVTDCWVKGATDPTQVIAEHQLST